MKIRRRLTDKVTHTLVFCACDKFVEASLHKLRLTFFPQGNP
jgi:hypothetical protein